MSYQAETPFDSIEGSHEYVALLAEALDAVTRARVKPSGQLDLCRSARRIAVTVDALDLASVLAMGSALAARTAPGTAAR